MTSCSQFLLPAGRLLAVCALPFWLAGCATSSGDASRPQPPGKNEISEVSLYGIPVALNFDTVPGPDGFVVRVYVSTAARARGVTISSGTFEVLMFDGVLRAQSPGEAQPLRSWQFSPASLRPHATATSIGNGYQFELTWGEARPSRSHITVLARYTPARGEAVYSAPSVISLAAK